MPSVLDSLLAQRAEAISAMDNVLSQVEGRDLVDAEVHILTATEQRIAELDAQIAPLQAFESMRRDHAGTLDTLPRPMPEARRVAPEPADINYRSAGDFLVDYLRARGIMERGVNDPEAQGRVTRAVANTTTPNLPGILPTPIVGQVVDIIDSNRPLITSLGGARALGGIPGTTFSRPKITTHTTVGKQSAEKTELPSQTMVISPITFTKNTYGGTVDISRQAIDWTSPAAWDIVVRDLADVYAIATETAIATAFVTAATGTPVTLATNDLPGWATALYAAAAESYMGGKRMPDRVWCSIDVWSAMGSIVDQRRPVMPPDRNMEQPAGQTSLGTFGGYVFDLPRIVVPTFPAKTCIVGPSSLYEVYEEVIGLLSMVEPSILGVQVAYGGYVAQGSLEGTAFVPITGAAVP